MSKNIKIWFFIAASFILIGCIIFLGVMIVLNWNFKRLSTDKFVTNEYELHDTFQNISLKTVAADVVFVPTDEQKAKVLCYEDEKIRHSVTVKDDTLVIAANDTRKWYHHIGIHFENPKITISIPNREYNTLTIKNTTGDVKIPQGFTFSNADVSVTTGDISLKSSVTDDIRCKSTTGEVNLAGIRCNTLTANVTTGDIKMKDVIAREKITIRQCTGDVEFEACDAAELFIKVTTGHVKGTLLTDKIFTAKATTGRVDVPKSQNGGICKVSTTTGDIKIDITH